jgi:predicted N-acyltransferase
VDEGPEEADRLEAEYILVDITQEADHQRDTIEDRSYKNIREERREAQEKGLHIEAIDLAGEEAESSIPWPPHPPLSPYIQHEQKQ